MKFYLGTTNPNKVAEIAAILRATGYELEVTPPVEPEETEPDFLGNAELKARVYSSAVNGWTISEDSGLVIPALSGLPGVFSARFSDCALSRGPADELRVVEHVSSGRTREEMDRSNCLRVLELMQGVVQPYRAARFEVALSVCSPEGEIRLTLQSKTSGWISNSMQGENGFGYDPIFVGQDTNGLTYAQLDSARKNLRSHRRKVLQDLKAWLASARLA